MKKKVFIPVFLFVLYSCAGLLIGSDAQREFEKGLALFNAGNYEQAAPHFVKATELEPEFGRAYLYLGRSYLNLRQWLDAIPPLRTAYRLSPTETRKEALDILMDALLAAATDAFKRGNFQGALSHLREGLALSPQSESFQHQLVDNLIGYGGQLLSRGKFSQAISAYTEVIDLSPNQFDAYLGLAKAFFKQGNVMQALQAAQKAAKINPSSAEAQSLFFDLLKQQ
jgi:tetratricopeptide (TPR) repeat protein